MSHLNFYCYPCPSRVEQTAVLVSRVDTLLVFDEQGGNEFADAQPMTGKSNIHSCLPLSRRFPDVRHHQRVNGLRSTGVEVVQALAFRKFLVSLMQDRPETLGEVLFNGQTRRLLPSPRVTLGYTEMLLAQEGRFFEVGLRIGLGIAYGLSCPEGSLERRRIYGSELRAGQRFSGSPRLLWARPVSEWKFDTSNNSHSCLLPCKS